MSDVETNKGEPLITCRKRKDTIKTERESLARDKHGGYLIQEESIKSSIMGLFFLVTVHAVTGMEAAPTHHRLQSGTREPSSRCKGRNPIRGTERNRIPKRDAGAEQPVVAMNPRNRWGAKKLCHPVP